MRPTFGCRRSSPRKASPRRRVPAHVDSRLEVLDGIARFTIGLELASPNKTLWKNWRVKSDDRQAWGAAIFNAIVVCLEANGEELSVLDRQVIANRPMPVVENGKTIMRRLHRAPRQTYRVLITREVPSTRNFIRDDDNLMFASKALRDALKAHSVIYEDSREWLTCPLPVQRVAEDGQFRTIVDVSPWVPPRLPGRSNAAD